MPAVKKYTRVNFQNYPSISTPLNATNLNKLDKGIDDLDDEVVTVKNAITTINDNLSKHTISPDTKVALTKDTEYTTLADGYFRIQSELGDRYVTGYINNIAVMQLLPKSSSSVGASLENMSIFVRKGTEIKYGCSSTSTSTSASGVFFPLA